MSDVDPNIPDDCEDELKQALLAAFGDDAMDLLDDDGLDEIPDEMLHAVTAGMDECPTTEESGNQGRQPDAAVSDYLTPSENDSARDRWIKELCRAIYFPERVTRQDSALRPDHSASRSKDARHIVFAIGQQQFAIPLCDVCEIARNPKITELPCTAAWLRGVTNLRGQILSVTDLRNLLQIDSRRPVVGEKIIVIHNRQQAATTALAVDRVIGIRNVTNEQTDVSDLSPLIASVANGLATVDKSMTVLIDSEQLLGCEELLAYA